MTKDVFAQLSLRNPKNFAAARTNMMKQQIRTWDVFDKQILELFFKVPREDYVPVAFKELAYADISIPLGHGQSMMPPKEEARILQQLKITPKDKVLVLGIDSGYLINLLSRLARTVHYVADDLEFFEDAKQKISAQKLPNVFMATGSINHGWQQQIPYDVILLTGSLPSIPDELRNAITINGRLFLVVGNLPIMEAVFIHRTSKDTWSEIKLYETDRPRMLDVQDFDKFQF